MQVITGGHKETSLKATDVELEILLIPFKI
jgi:hypothetical protein